MNISELPVPETLVRSYREQGIEELYPPQEECVRKGLFEGKNQLIAVPTASGKTLVAEMAMHHHVSRGGKCLYIVPLKALASEKHAEFGERGLRIGIATGDYDRRDEFLGQNDIIIATSEKMDSLLRNRAPWLDQISLLVVDEVHLLDSPDRGPTLEMVITKLRYRARDLQILALSATIGNPLELGAWLEAEVITSSWRPVELRQGIFHRGTIFFGEQERKVPRISRFEDLNLVLDTLNEGGQCLVFVGSRRNAESFARKVAGALDSGGEDLQALSERLRTLAETEMERDLAACVARGSAFHHAGLGREARKVVEGGFRKGLIRCIASTPTLAAGLNLPARRVLIRDHLRYESGEGMVPIPVREYHQMAGRAGRPHLDPYGEAVLMAREEGDVERLTEWYINSPPEKVSSRCNTTWALCAHVLSLIATGFAGDSDELRRFLQHTYYQSQRGDPALMEAILSQSLRYLREWEMVTRLGERYSATDYGELVSRLYLDPRSADLIFTTLAEIAAFTDLGFLHLVCQTPDMPTLRLRKSDYPLLDRILRESGEDLWVEMPYHGDEDMETYLRGLKTALLLRDWTRELGEESICERYGVGPGDIHGMVEGVQWLVHAGARLSSLCAPHLASALRDFEQQVRHGIRSELLPLTRLRGIGRVRARRLFNNGMTTPAAVREAGRSRVIPILGARITEQIFRQLEDEQRGAEGQRGLEEWYERRES